MNKDFDLKDILIGLPLQTRRKYGGGTYGDQASHRADDRQVQACLKGIMSNISDNADRFIAVLGFLSSMRGKNNVRSHYWFEDYE